MFQRSQFAVCKSRPLTFEAAARGVVLLSSVLFCGTLATGQNLGRWQAPDDYTDQVYSGCPQFSEIAHAALLPVGLHQGKVLLWNRQPDPSLDCQLPGTSRFWLFDPGNPHELIEIEQQLESNIFCAGHSWDPAGRLVVVGGDRSGPVECYRFRPRNLGGIIRVAPVPYGTIPVETYAPWIRLNDLNHGRYYPGLLAMTRRSLYLERFNSSTATVEGGIHLVLGGPPHAHSTDGQVEWDWIPYGVPPPETESPWPDPLQPTDPTTQSTDPYPPPVVGVDNGKVYYTISGTSTPNPQLDSYPRAFQLSSEDILIVNDVDTSSPANEPGVPRIIRVDYEPGSPSTAFANKWELWNGRPAGAPCVGGSGGPTEDRNWGSAVLLHTLDKVDRILVFGGKQVNCSSTNLINDSVQEFEANGTSPPTAANGIWHSKQPLSIPREHCNAVILPTGEVLITGGNSIATTMHHDAPVFYPELYNIGVQPRDDGTQFGDTNSTTPMATSSLVALPGTNPVQYSPTARMYHHLAVLLLDGRVLVAGGEKAHQDVTSGQYTAELFSPPYLVNPPFKPIIESVTGAPLALSPKSGSPNTFTITATVTVSGGYNNVIQKVVLLRPAAVTHHFDFDQRYIELGFTSAGSGETKTLTVACPGENLAPPGWYTLWVIEAESASSSAPRIPSTATLVQFL